MDPWFDELECHQIAKKAVNLFHAMWSIAIESPTEVKMTARAWITYLKKLKAEIDVIHHAMGQDVVSIDNMSFKQMVVKYLLLALSNHEDHLICAVVKEVQARITTEQMVKHLLKEVVLQVKQDCHRTRVLDL